jgi:SWI/SNF-related matrix-associated actin-dependent regulator of chromatin subfamily A3
MARGILRLEGFVQRLHESQVSAFFTSRAHTQSQFEIRVNVLFFTLPSNVRFIADDLLNKGIYLLDPVPPYEPNRHSDRPPYYNAHGGHHNALSMMMAAHNRAYRESQPSWQMLHSQDKTSQVEVQRQQVDEVFKSMEGEGTMELSDPGE